MISRGFYRFLRAMSRMGSHFSGKTVSVSIGASLSR